MQDCTQYAFRSPIYPQTLRDPCSRRFCWIAGGFLCSNSVCQPGSTNPGASLEMSTLQVDASPLSLRRHLLLSSLALCSLGHELNRSVCILLRHRRSRHLFCRLVAVPRPAPPPHRLRLSLSQQRADKGCLRVVSPSKPASCLSAVSRALEPAANPRSSSRTFRRQQPSSPSDPTIQSPALATHVR